MEVLPIIISQEDFIGGFKNPKQYFNWINSKQKSHKVIKIKNRLYALVDPSTGNIYANRFQIASRLTQTSFLCFHSALEFFGLSNQVFNVVSVGSETTFHNFNFDNIEYQYCKSESNEFVENDIASKTKMTCLEKTAVDCLDCIEKAGGYEEVSEALGRIKYLNEEKLISILKNEKKIILYKKVGYFFSVINCGVNLSDDFFAFCKKQIKAKKDYLIPKSYQNGTMKMNSEWKLIVPVPSDHLY
jgi:predicted transcriptional regulator of viral defense system